MTEKVMKIQPFSNIVYELKVWNQVEEWNNGYYNHWISIDCNPNTHSFGTEAFIQLHNNGYSNRKRWAAQTQL